MKAIYNILMAICLINSAAALAQTEEINSSMAAVARYKDNCVELRWIPEHRRTLQNGFIYGYQIERFDSSTKTKSLIGKIVPYTKSQFDSLIAIEIDNETSTLLNYISEFIYKNPSQETNTLDLESGVKSLLQAKGKEDMNELILSLSIIKNQKIAESLGMCFIDCNVKKNEKYTYTIKPLSPDKVYKVSPATVDINSSEKMLLYQTPIAVYPKESGVSFYWDADRKIAGFYVEKAMKIEGPFTPINSTPFYASKGNLAVFTDDSIPNYTIYYYRFFGLNPFGDKVYLGSAKGMGIDKTPPCIPSIKQPKHIQTKAVEINWEMPVKEGDLRGFIVARSKKDTGQFKILHTHILPPQKRSFIDSSFTSGENNYYVVYAYDTAGNVSVSNTAYVVLIDSLPPEIPTFISAKMDSLGVVTIRLKPGKETDLKGYKLFRANGIEHEFSWVQNLFTEDTAWQSLNEITLYDTVSLHTSTPHVFYKIKALDLHYNSSDFSEIYKVIRIDTICPSAPVFTDILVKEDKIILHFEPSPSKDVASHIIYRKNKEQDVWKAHVIFKGNLKQYTDTGLVANQEYYYTIKAKDYSNLFSAEANAVKGIPYPTGVLKNITKINIKNTEKGIELQWQYEAKRSDISFVIYKEDKDGKLYQYAVSENLEFLDKQKLRINTYAIKVVHTDGSKSSLSEKISFIAQ